MLSRAPDDFDLAEAALLVAQREYPGLDVAHYLGRLDGLAERARRGLPAHASTLETVTVLNRVLYEVEGYAGDADDFYNPCNSYLNMVLDHKRGIPITLSIIYLAVGRRLGLALDGVSFPGHFLVRLGDGADLVILDPYLRGQVVSEAAMNRRLQDLYGADAPALTRDMLAAAAPREILARLARNLKGIYLHTQDYERALYAANCVLLATPDMGDELRDRGRIFERLECYRAASADFRRYLDLKPDAADLRDIRARLLLLQRAAARLN
jgi:regulator of sirC expression with transglutaminase-like and TPR domain